MSRCFTIKLSNRALACLVALVFCGTTQDSRIWLYRRRFLSNSASIFVLTPSSSTVGSCTGKRCSLGAPLDWEGLGDSEARVLDGGLEFSLLNVDGSPRLPVFLCVSLLWLLRGEGMDCDFWGHEDYLSTCTLGWYVEAQLLRLMDIISVNTYIPQKLLDREEGHSTYWS